jgi:hypothetical protein
VKLGEGAQFFRLAQSFDSPVMTGDHIDHIGHFANSTTTALIGDRKKRWGKKGK